MGDLLESTIIQHSGLELAEPHSVYGTKMDFFKKVQYCRISNMGWFLVGWALKNGF